MDSNASADYHAAVRLLGFLLTILGVLGLATGVRGTFEKARPKDVAFALLALLASLVTILGLALAFVPGFLG